MDSSVRIPLIDETARREDSEWNSERPTVKGFLLLDDDIRKPADDLTEENAKSMLYQYARDGKVGPLLEILRKYRDDVINAADKDEGLTALHFAARYGRVDVVRELLLNGADANAQTEEGYTPLHMTAKYCRSETTVQSSREHIKREDFAKASTRSLPGRMTESADPPAKRIIDMLIKANALTDTQNNYGMTPLHYAAMKDNKIAAEALIDKGAQVNPDDKKEMSPLLTACVYGSQNVVELLLEKGADIGAVRASDRSTAFHIAAQHGKKDTLRSLLNKAKQREKLFLRMTNNELNTPLCLAVESGYLDTTELILSKLGNIDNTGKEQWLLHVAASRGYLKVVEILIKYQADPAKPNADQRRPVHLAAKNNHADVVKYLVNLDPSCLHARDDLGLTPLLLAASFKEAMDAIKVLVDDCGARIDDKDHENRSAVYIAAKYNAVKTLEYLLGKLREEDQKSRRSLRTGVLHEMINQYDHSQNTPMHIVCSNGYLESCKLLKENGAEVDCLNEDEETPLHMAAAKGRTETVRQLLEWDTRLVSHKDEMGNTPLHLAARGGYDVALKVLLDAGSDKETKNERNDTPLDVAVYFKKIDCVRLLVQYGAVIEQPQSATTPLHVAAEVGDEEMVRFLLRSRVDIARRNADGQTALEIAISLGYREVARALIEHENWKRLMIGTGHIPLGRHREPRRTPMRELIKKFPDVAALVFDKCITRKEDGTEYDFSLLEDTYMMVKEKGEDVLCADLEPFSENGKLKPEANKYTADPDVVYKNHPLKLIAASERMSLLGHPLVKALIKHKWNSLGRYVYYSALAIYLFFIMLFTYFVVQTPAPYNVINEESGEHEDLTKLLETTDATCEIPVKHPGWFFKWTIIVLSVAQMCKEVFQLFHRRMAYFSMENLLELTIYGGAVLTVWDFNECSHFTGLRMPLQWLLAALVAFLSWMNLLMLIRKLPKFGIYVVMFFDIIRTFLRFSIIFALFVVAFSITFYLILQNRPEFSTIPSSLLKTTVMMIGEFEFTAIFHGDSAVHTEKLFGLGIAYPLFLLFCILMTIILMNLLVGLAVDDIKAVQEKAELRRLSMQVDLVLQIEATMPWIHRKTIRGRYRFFTIKELSFIGRLIRSVTTRFGFQPPIEEEIEVVKSEEEELMTQLREEQRAQSAQVANLQANVDVMYEKQLQLEDMLKLLLQHNNIKYRNIDT